MLCQIKTSMIHCRVKLKLSKTSLIHLWVKLSALWDSAESNWALPRTWGVKVQTSLNKTVRDKLSIVQGSDETSFRVQTKRCSGQCWINKISFSCTTLFTRTVLYSNYDLNTLFLPISCDTPCWYMYSLLGTKSSDKLLNFNPEYSRNRWRKFTTY